MVKYFSTLERKRLRAPSFTAQSTKHTIITSANFAHCFPFKIILSVDTAHYVKRLIRAMLAIVLLSPYSQSIASNAIEDVGVEELMSSEHFATWQGIEPDKWATIWLIKRKLVPSAYFSLLAPNSTLPQQAYPFAVSQAKLKRAQLQSMYRRLLKAADISTPALLYLDQIIHDIEVEIWDEATHPHTEWLETMFRKLQARYHKDFVPVDCYLAFFDGVHELAKLSQVDAQDYSDRLELTDLCPGINTDEGEYVKRLSHLEVLRRLSIGENIMFIDTREDEEYQDLHLPGAKLLRLRDVNEDSVKFLKEADLVVAYCVKDFRGFEVAKLMKYHGVDKVATLSPNGLKGWIASGLPISQKNGLSDTESTEQLMRCSMEPSSCLRSGM